MPIYEYRCTSCGNKFELLRPLTHATEDVPCPKCNNGAKRVLSSFASFSKSSDGTTTAVAGTGSSCGGCSSTNCSTCH